MHMLVLLIMINSTINNTITNTTSILQIIFFNPLNASFNPDSYSLNPYSRVLHRATITGDFVDYNHAVLNSFAILICIQIFFQFLSRFFTWLTFCASCCYCFERRPKRTAEIKIDAYFRAVFR